MKPKGYVYFIYAPMVGRVKIGYSAEHPDRRLFALQIASPVPLERFAFVRGVPRLEFVWHERFKSLRVLGEWFEATPELLEALSREAEAWMPRERRPRKPAKPPAVARKPAKPPGVPKERVKLPSVAKVLGGGAPGRKSGVWKRGGASGGAWYTTIRGQQLWLAPASASLRQAEKALLSYARETGTVDNIVVSSRGPVR